MKPVAPMRYQRGALSLMWCAVLMAVAAAAGLFGLMSMRQERNLFDEARVRLLDADATRSIVRAGEAIGPAAAAVHKCVTDGKTTYSNTGCEGGRQAGRIVELHDARGVEAPRIPASPGPAQEVAAGLRGHMIDRTVSH